MGRIVKPAQGLNVHLYRIKGGAWGLLQGTRGARQLTEVKCQPRSGLHKSCQPFATAGLIS